MIRIRQTFGAHTGRVFELDKEVIRFGRLPTCDVAFDPQADIDASGQHADLRREANGWVIVDSGSRNGTWLNGQRVQTAAVSNGDELEFGRGGPRVRIEIDDMGARAVPYAVTVAATPIGGQNNAAAQDEATRRARPGSASPMPGGAGLANAVGAIPPGSTAPQGGLGPAPVPAPVQLSPGFAGSPFGSQPSASAPGPGASASPFGAPVATPYGVPSPMGPHVGGSSHGPFAAPVATPYASPSGPSPMGPRPSPGPFAAPVGTPFGMPSPAPSPSPVGGASHAPFGPPVSSPYGAPGAGSRPGSGPGVNPGPFGAPVATPYGGPAGMPGGGPRVGAKTVAMMIQSAMDQARQQGVQGGNRSTAFLRAIAHEAAHESSRALKIALVLVIVLLVAALIALAIVLSRLYGIGEDARDESVRLQTELASLGAGDTSHGREIEARLSELNAEILPKQRAIGEQLVAANAQTLYLVVARGAAGERATCTAFAVQADLLATSGRCVVAMERERAQGGMLVARPHGGGTDLPVSQLWQHPSFTSGGAAHADVGLVQISGQAPMAATLATIDQVGAFTASEDVFVVGFPRDTPIAAPRARFSSGVAGRIAADASGLQAIEHSAFDAASGGPLFNKEGAVVAIEAGGPSEPARHAARIEVLLSLLAGMRRL